MSNAVLRQKILYPAVVAIIGASATQGRLTARPQHFMARHGFKGRVYPVNPRRAEVQGVKAYASVKDIPEVVDHAYILLDADPALIALQECADAGVKAVSLLADGFSEAGAVGEQRQKHLNQIANDHGIALIGPNSTGVIETSRQFVCTSNAAFAGDHIPTGRFAVLSQSGSMTGAILSRSNPLGLGFKAYISVVNEASLGVGEMGQMLVDDPAIEGFVLFLETLRRPGEIAKFADMARHLGKPVVAYLVGRSDAGQALAASHTGAMVGGSKAMEAFLGFHGIHQVDNFEALIESANALQLGHRLASRPRSATIVTTTGGGGGMVYDLIGMQGVTMAPMNERSINKLADQGITVKPGPLVDVTMAGTRYDTMKAVISTLIEDPDSGMVIAAIGSSAQFNPEIAVKPIVDAVRESSPGAAPVMAFPIPNALESIQRFNSNGVPAFRTAESVAQTAGLLLRAGRQHRSINTSPPAITATRIAAAGGGAMTEVEAGEVFKSLGLNTPRACFLMPGESLGNKPDFSGPYVLKVVSREILHKTDVGGVVVGLADRSALREALVNMSSSIDTRVPNARVEGYLVQEMLTGVGEAIIGLSRDPVVGPVISVGLGGVMTEIYQDIALRPAPVDRQSANEMIDEVKGFALLKGYRGSPPGDLKALVETIVSISGLANIDRVLEAEVNPVLVRGPGEGVVLLDALMVLEA